MQQNMPICSLQFERFPAIPNAPAKFFVMAATANPCRYFQFIGGPDFASLFAYYQELDRQNCTELPGDLNYTELRFFTKPGEPRASRFALLTGFATYYGSLYFGSQTAGEQLTADTRDTHHTVAPLSIALTEFHLLSLYPRKLTVRNILSDSVVYERDSAAELRGMCPDPLTGFVWVFSDKELFVVGSAGIWGVDRAARRGPRRVEALPAERARRRARRLRKSAGALQGRLRARGGAPRPGRLLLPQARFPAGRGDAAVAGGDRAAVSRRGRARRAEDLSAAQAGPAPRGTARAAHAAVHVADGDLPGRDQRDERRRGRFFFTQRSRRRRRKRRSRTCWWSFGGS